MIDLSNLKDTKLSADKLTIYGYKDTDLSQAIPNGVFTSPINPASISLSYTTNFNVEEGANTNTPEVKYYGGSPPKLSFELTIDGTGMIGDSLEAGMSAAAAKSQSDTFTPVDVVQQIENFKTACHYYISDKHETPYVKIQWGETLLKYKKSDFAGRLESLTINYTLFAKDGTPLRAKLSASFTGTFNPKTGTKIQSTSSPDLTHLITVKAGDSLPAMCKNIYGNAKYCHQVAKINKLANFRKLEPGQTLEFPPMK